MRRSFLFAVGALISGSAMAEEQYVYSPPPSEYSQAELNGFARENRMPVTPRHRQIINFDRKGNIQTISLNTFFCDTAGNGYKANFSFLGKANHIALAVRSNREIFFYDLDQQRLNLDGYLREHFTKENMQSPETLRQFLDHASQNIKGSGRFLSTLSGSAKFIKHGCAMS